MEFKIKLNLNAFWFIVTVNVVLFVLATIAQLIAPDLVSDQSGKALTQIFNLLGGMSLSSFVAGRVWTIITANFLHIEIFHFLLNMLALFYIGRKVYNFYGGRKFFTAYIVGGIISMLATLGVSFLTLTDIATLGASGSLFALAGVLIAGSLKNRRYGIDLPLNIMDFLPLITISLLYGFLPGSGVNNWAHLGGLLTGLILGFAFKHELGEHKNSLDRLLENILYYFSVAAFTLSYILLIITSIALILG